MQASHLLVLTGTHNAKVIELTVKLFVLQVSTDRTSPW
jgi:hypothetical protein